MKESVATLVEARAGSRSAAAAGEREADRGAEPGDAEADQRDGHVGSKGEDGDAGQRQHDAQPSEQRRADARLGPVAAEAAGSDQPSEDGVADAGLAAGAHHFAQEYAPTSRPWRPRSW